MGGRSRSVSGVGVEHTMESVSLSMICKQDDDDDDESQSAWGLCLGRDDILDSDTPDLSEVIPMY
jgi:hypothetical protein